MSTPASSQALTTSNGESQGFAQQGSLDWVALGRAQYSVSIAILGRLAKAGIDTLTVAVGQAMCVQLPIGPHGEKALAEAMTGLTAKSFAADLLWFGVGVRHILHELVQTSPGCSLIALCAALTESHSIKVSALVLYEIAKECGGPQELSPSLEQWEALVRIAASAFNTTTFGLRIHQIAKFGMPRPGQNPLKSPTSHPSCLATILLSIGQIVRGSLESVSIHGGVSCSWIAAWADFVLGLRVLIRDANGIVVYANYNTEEASAQVNVRFLAEEDHGRMLLVRSSYWICSGMDFIQKCFRRPKPVGTASADFHFFPGRLQWDTMFSDTFGDQIRILMERKAGEPSHLSLFARTEAGDDACEEMATHLTGNQIFCRMLAIAIIVITALDSPDMHSGGARSYFVRASENIPELRLCSEQVLFAIGNFLTLYGSEDSLLDGSAQPNPLPVEMLIKEYTLYNTWLTRRCSCRHHHRAATENISHFCLPQLARMVLRAISLFDRIVLDTPLKPTMYGLFRLYEMCVRSDKTPQNPIKFINELAIPIDGSCSTSFYTAAGLFGAEDWDVERSGTIAQCDGKVYCYNQLLEGLTDSLQEARQIHVGSGQIEYFGRIHRTLYGTAGQTDYLSGYPTRETKDVSSIDSLKLDSTSSPINAQLLVEEDPSHLSLRHHISTGRRATTIAPTTFMTRLQQATSYKHCNRYSNYDRWAWISVLQGSRYTLVQGEGTADEPDGCHMLRPLRGNVLGRCVAISMTTSPMALVRTQEELELFARFWAKANESDRWPRRGGKPGYYALIS